MSSRSERFSFRPRAARSFRSANSRRVYVTEGPAQISREMAQRRIVIECNVTDRDIGSFVQEAKEKIDAAVKLPPGYLMTWGGQFENQQRAMKRFAIVVPITIAAIFLLLFSSFNSVKQAVLIILNIPVCADRRHSRARDRTF